MTFPATVIDCGTPVLIALKLATVRTAMMSILIARQVIMHLCLFFNVHLFEREKLKERFKLLGFCGRLIGEIC